jgi:hypothetical protein
MKEMKVIYMMQNMMNQEIQQFVVSQSIEVMNAKMLLIQFVSRLSLAQMKLTKLFDSMRKMMIQEF